MKLSPDDPHIVDYEDNLLNNFKSITLSLDGTFTETDTLTWFDTGRPYFPRFNGVLRTVLSPGQDLASVVDPVLAHFQERRLPFFWADYPPGAASGLVEILRARGVSIGPYTLQGMARSLRDLPESPKREEIAITEVRSTQEEAEWLDILMEGFHEPEPTRPDFREFLRRSVVDPQYRFHHYLARWQGAPCAIASLLRAPQAAGLYHVTTLPAYRGRGLGTAITLETMLIARQMGYERMVLFATPEGYPLYLGMGFEEGLRIELYISMGGGEPKDG
jgi:GNAT superfamily N-acetyltransferase